MGLIIGMIDLIWNEGQEIEIGMGLEFAALLASALAAAAWIGLAHFLPAKNPLRTELPPIKPIQSHGQAPYLSEQDSSNPYQSPYHQR